MFGDGNLFCRKLADHRKKKPRIAKFRIHLEVSLYNVGMKVIYRSTDTPWPEA